MSNNNISVKEYMIQYKFKNSNITNFNLHEYIRLVEYVTKIDKNYIFVNMDDIYLSTLQVSKLDDLLNKLYIEFVPLQYLLSTQSFFNEQYFVNENVLIPRSDSEILVETSIKYIEKYDLKNMIDMCTGSGCIGISIVKNSNISSALLVDISKKAIDVADKNIKLNNIQNKCRTICSDIFSNLFNLNDKYDIIVSNPPYVKKNVISTLSQYVQNEPIIALDGGVDGLEIYRNILKQATYFLNDSGFLIFEIGYDQKQDLIYEIKKHVEYEYIECIKDLSGNDRVIVCRFHKI